MDYSATYTQKYNGYSCYYNVHTVDIANDSNFFFPRRINPFNVISFYNLIRMPALLLENGMQFWNGSFPYTVGEEVLVYDKEAWVKEAGKSANITRISDKPPEYYTETQNLTDYRIGCSIVLKRKGEITGADFPNKYITFNIPKIPVVTMVAGESTNLWFNSAEFYNYYYNILMKTIDNNIELVPVLNEYDTTNNLYNVFAGYMGTPGEYSIKMLADAMYNYYPTSVMAIITKE